MNPDGAPRFYKGPRVPCPPRPTDSRARSKSARPRSASARRKGKGKGKGDARSEPSDDEGTNVERGSVSRTLSSLYGLSCDTTKFFVLWK